MPRARKDITGLRSGKLVVIRPDGVQDRSKSVMWLCQCDCGGTKRAYSQDLVAGRTKSCGCVSRGRKAGQIENLAGKRFGNLTAISPTDERTKAGSAIWLCRCDCGKTKLLPSARLKWDTVKSCGCRERRRKARRATQGGI